MVRESFSGELVRAGLYFIPKNKKMNADSYLKVLQGRKLYFFHIRKCEVLMQDSALCHKAKKDKRFLRNIKLI